LSSFCLLELRDAEREPVVAGAALGDDLGEDLLGALEAAVLHQLLGVDAAAREVVLRLLPVLVEAGEEVFEADRDGATLLVLHLHGGAVEAEELPHLLDGEGGGAGVELLLELVRRLGERDDDDGVAGDAVRKRAHRRDDRRSALDLRSRLHARPRPPTPSSSSVPRSGPMERSPRSPKSAWPPASRCGSAAWPR
jgi:hypothetical protein